VYYYIDFFINRHYLQLRGGIKILLSGLTCFFFLLRGYNLLACYIIVPMVTSGGDHRSRRSCLSVALWLRALPPARKRVTDWMGQRPELQGRRPLESTGAAAFVFFPFYTLWIHGHQKRRIFIHCIENVGCSAASNSETIFFLCAMGKINWNRKLSSILLYHRLNNNKNNNSNHVCTWYVFNQIIKKNSETSLDI
jgi:hypothetical protein